MGNQVSEAMTRSVLVDYRSDLPIEAHPQVRALMDQGWAVKHMTMKSGWGNRRFRVPRVLVRLMRRTARASASARPRSRLAA